MRRPMASGGAGRTRRGVKKPASPARKPRLSVRRGVGLLICRLGRWLGSRLGFSRLRGGLVGRSHGRFGCLWGGIRLGIGVPNGGRLGGGFWFGGFCFGFG